MKEMFNYPSRLLAATGLLSIALIAYQIAIIQVLSFTQWHHYAYMVISIALLGFGASGTFLSLKRDVLLRQSKTLLPFLMILSGVLMLLPLWVGNSDMVRFDSYLLFVERKQWFALVINYLLYFLPFFCGALALGIIFIGNVSQIGKYYFSNLLGSGIGAVIAALLAWYFVPASLPAVVSMIAIAAGIILFTKDIHKLMIVFAATATAICSFRIFYPVTLVASEYKSLSRTLNLPNATISLEKASPYGLVQVVSADALRYAPGLSLSFTGEVPVKKAVFNNGDWYGPLISWSVKDTFHLLDYTTSALPYELKKINNVLTLHSGTGMFVSHALRRNASFIDAVEPHSAISDLLTHELASDNDSLFYNTAVHLHTIEPRTFLTFTKNKYNLIQFPIIGDFGGTSGLHATREEYILTKEAFLQMWNLLDNDGMVCITAWMDYPFRNPLKIASTIAEVMDEIKIANPEMHLAAVRNWGTITFILKKSSLTEIETGRIRKFCDRYYFDPVLLPDISKDERTKYNGMSDPTYFKFIDQILSDKAKREEFYTEYDFQLQPATDNKPYFSQFLRLKSLPKLSALFGSDSVPFIELGFIILLLTVVQISLLAIVLIILPLFKIGWKGKSRNWTFLYFSCIGIGYMFLEIVFMQKFILFLGNPVYAATLVIGIMMLGSGIGSLVSSYYPINRHTLKFILLMIVSLLLLYSFFLPSLLENILGLAAFQRISVLITLVIIPSFIMGFPFPIGLKLLSHIEEKNVPWAWGVNGCMSVISASLAALIAIEAGFMTVIILASFAYGVSLCSLFLLKTSSKT
ncbi:hypothetical protein FEDK69T_29220 [Flavobacterium enshiense DK69]|uniref:Spermidine synthase n=2 Tax=Flavobacterium TaxID=237 RepID=V6S1W5_9FLAO|nr:hypothetical protein FEDK69T_29220 [Flavobacterium enshiense DK69]KGO95790.1 hypothetical protein Q767_08850 [Flavobacterium enshiense DK69]